MGLNRVSDARQREQRSFRRRRLVITSDDGIHHNLGVCACV